jgi:hypothetical protein
MNKEFLHMQKLAGLITESEYNHQKAQLWYEDYAKEIKKALNDFKNAIEDERSNA